MEKYNHYHYGLQLATQLNAQSFWKKLEKNVGKVGKEIDKVVNTDTTNSTTTTTSSGVTITTPHRNLVLEIISAELSDKHFIVELLLTNKGEDIQSYSLSGSDHFGKDPTKIFDNLGNECSSIITFGNNVGHFGNGVANILLSDVPVKVILDITGFSSKATKISQIRISGETSSYEKAPFPASGYFVLKNISITK